MHLPHAFHPQQITQPREFASTHRATANARRGTTAQGIGGVDEANRLR